MATSTVDDYLAELAEVEEEIRETVGAANFQVGSLSVDETAAYKQLINRRGHLQWTIKNMQAGGSALDNCGASYQAQE